MMGSLPCGDELVGDAERQLVVDAVLVAVVGDRAVGAIGLDAAEPLPAEQHRDLFQPGAPLFGASAALHRQDEAEGALLSEIAAVGAVDRRPLGPAERE